MAMTKRASAHWQGGLKDGRGTISTQSGALEARPYGFAQRFEGVEGSNPEELIAAAHASCYAMALSMMLGEEGLTADDIKVDAKVTLDEVSDGFAITCSHLSLRARVPGADEATFRTAAEKAKEGCPVSKLLNAEIRLDCSLEQ